MTLDDIKWEPHPLLSNAEWCKRAVFGDWALSIVSEEDRPGYDVMIWHDGSPCGDPGRLTAAELNGLIQGLEQMS